MATLLDDSSGTDSMQGDSSSDDEAYARFVSRLDVGSGPGAPAAPAAPGGSGSGAGTDGRARRRRAVASGGDSGEEDQAEAEWERVPRRSYTGVAGSESDGDEPSGSGRLPVRTLGGGRLKALQSTAASRHVPATAAAAAAAEAAAEAGAGRTARSDAQDGGDEAEASTSEAAEARDTKAARAQASGRLSMPADQWLAMPPRSQDKRYQRMKALIANLAQRIMAWPEVCVSGAPYAGGIAPIQAPPVPVHDRRGSKHGDGEGDGGSGAGDDADAVSRRKARRLANKERARKERAQSQHSRKSDLLLALHSLVADGDPRVARMALLSESAVFMDVLPDFRIRLPTEKEAAVRVSREVKEARAYDAALLRGYQRCLKALERLMLASEPHTQRATAHMSGGGSAQATPAALGIVAIKCMSQLMAARPEFNFGGNLITTVVRASCDT